MMVNKLPGEDKPAKSVFSTQSSNTEPVLVDTGLSVLDDPFHKQCSDLQNNLASSIFACPQQVNAEYSDFQNQQLSTVQSKLSEVNAWSYSETCVESTAVPDNTSIIPNKTSRLPGFSDEKSTSYNPNSSTADFCLQSSAMMPSTTFSNCNNYGRNPNFANSNISNQNYSAATPYDMSATNLYNTTYEPVNPYWLYKDIIETKEIWYGFSNVDSDKLEQAFQQDPEAVVPVDGGRYDTKLSDRRKKSVYFDAKDMEIRRCTWFYRPDSSQRFIPFSEEAATLLEQHYCNCVTSGQWQKIVHLPGIGSVVMENPQLLLCYKNEVDLWPPLPNSKASPRMVKRGLPENFEIVPDESSCIDHLVFIVQGIGSFCDLKFRTVSECVDGFRDIANKLLSSHFKNEVECGRVGRVEFLPLAWHAKLHTSDKGFDSCMRNITLPSIPKLRHFTNDTLLDILLYSSPSYCQCIINTVASELNELHEIFLKRNPKFNGKVFVAGHSLGSLILFDILANQQTENNHNTSNEFYNDETISSAAFDGSNDASRDMKTSIKSLLQSCSLEEFTELFEKAEIDIATLVKMTDIDLAGLGLPDGPSKILLNAFQAMNHLESPSQRDKKGTDLLLEQPLTVSNYECENQTSLARSNCLTFPIKCSPCMSSFVYPRLQFEPSCFFALGSPISMFLAVRGYDTISEEFKLPTCPGFFHIFHPYDPVAFRIEPLIDPNFSESPVLIPHHKGRKRMHLEIRENLSKVGLEIKQKVLETLKYTWNSLSGFAKPQTFPAAVEAEVDKLVNKQMSESEFESQAPSESSAEDTQIGSLNSGRRIDYVLQEKPIEALNDYIFALTSHATYWDSEDTVLMILKEIYATQGILVSNENKPFPLSEHSDSKSFTHLNTVMSNPSLYKNSELDEYVHTNIVYHSTNQEDVPIANPVSTQCFNDSASIMSDISTAVPPASASQPIGPPPLTGFVKRSPFTK